MARLMTAFALLALVAGGAGIAWNLGKTRIESSIYKDRLRTLSAEHGQLAEQYNQAVRKTAVTELIVKDGALSVAVVTADGQRRVIPTPYDPSNEIFCDYVIVDGRLWIRRVYNSGTAPDDGIQIDPALAYIDWQDPRARYGYVIYRSLGEGRWIVTVTGGGALGLARVENDVSVDLQEAPVVQDFEEIEVEIEGQVKQVSPGEVVKHLFSR